MSRRRKQIIEKEMTNHPVASILIILITIGVSVADQYKLSIPDSKLTFSIIFVIFTLFINIFIFRLMGLHLAYRRTKKIEYWTFGQKIKLTLYLFFSIMMFAPNNLFGGFMYLIFFLGLLFVILRALWNKFTGVKKVLFSQKPHTRPNVNLVGMEEIDRMEGIEFEVFLSKLYDALGYFTEVTPPSGDFGADVITVKGKIKTVIQAKCYGEGKTVGVEAINEICGGAGYWNAKKKMVITNRYYTQSAIISAERNEVKLIDREGLQILLQEYRDTLEQNHLNRLLPFFSKSGV